MTQQFGRYSVTLSRLDKPLLGTYTKGDIITYYDAHAHLMLPFLQDHPLMMHRFPDGLTGESFYQKNTPEYFPKWIKRVSIEKKDGYYSAPLCQNRATLVYLANYACITPHIWLSRYDNLLAPDKIIFDLDPSTVNHEHLRTIACALHQVLTRCSLTSYLMTSGSQGYHIYVPIVRTSTFERTKLIATACAEYVINEHPELATLELRKNKRHGKIFIDTLRNQRGATAVAPYALRAYKHAPIATPISWKQLYKGPIDPQAYTMATIKTYLAAQDPWAEYRKTRQSVGRAYAWLAQQRLIS